MLTCQNSQSFSSLEVKHCYFTMKDVERDLWLYAEVQNSFIQISYLKVYLTLQYFVSLKENQSKFKYIKFWVLLFFMKL